MRPWLLFPVVLPALWAGITYAGLWPQQGPEWLASPIFAVVVTASGIAMALLADNLIRERRYVSKNPRWFRKAEKAAAKKAAEEAEILYDDRPLVKVETPLARAWRATREHISTIQVDMPDRRTATPAPRG